MRTPLLALALLAAPVAGLQSPSHHVPAPHHQRDWSANVVLPQSRAFHVVATAPAVQVTAVDAQILLVDGVATTTLIVSVANPDARPTEAELLLPVPDGAVVSGFDFEGSSPVSTAEVLARPVASATYDAIVAKLKDPALLEFAGAALVRSSVFPVPACGTQRVRIVYEHVLPTDGARLDYVLPRSESLALEVPWNVTVEVRSQRPIADVYSPTHDLPRVEGNATRVKLHARPGARMEAGPLRISVLLANGPVTTTLFTSADADGDGGWFLLLAGIGDLPANVQLAPREVTLVLDRSGSMAGEKFDQARASARQVLEGLKFGEAIGIIDYSSTVERFAPQAVVKTQANLPQLRAYLDGLQTGGGTDLDGALQGALAGELLQGFLPVVLFLTDGLPTAGETREHVIRERAQTANAHGRRLFTFGVGNDVNAPLLDALAERSRAHATYVRPNDDIELAVAGVFADLEGPVVTGLDLAVLDEHGDVHTRLVRDVYPQRLPDLFRGDRLLLLGRFTGREVGTFRLSGTKAGQPATWNLTHDFARALPRNDFVQRLWAMRRVAALEDELRQAGADPRALASLSDDPRLGEVAKELLALATRHGVLTDSTAFLALEGTALGDGRQLLAQTCSNGVAQSGARTGIQGVVIAQNNAINGSQGWGNFANCLYAADGELITNPTVQTIQGRTYFRRGERWVDGRLALKDAALAPDRTVEFGSPEHLQLVRELAARGEAGQLGLQGEILIECGGERVLVKPPAPKAEATPSGAAANGAQK